MPTYTINGKKIRTDKVLSDAEIEEIATDLGVTSATPTAQAGAPMGSSAAAQIPVGGMQAPAAQPTAPSGFVQGLLDPFRGGAQSISELLGAAGVPYFQREAQRMQESINAEEAAYKAQRQAAGEEGFDTGRLMGNIINPANLLALPARGVNAARAMLQTGVVGGAMQPAVTQPDTSFGEQKAAQIAGATIGSVAGSAAAKLAGQTLNPLISKAEQTMRDLGVQLTPGQMMGGQAKALEEFAANMPLVGSYIADAKEKAIFSFNKGVINKALGRVKEQLPEDVIGRDAVQYANDIIDKKYDEVLGKMKFKLDFPTYTNITKAVQVPPSASQRQTVKEIIDKVVYSKLPKRGDIDGTAYKGIESDLRKEAVAYSNSQTAGERKIGEALFEALDQLKTSLAKQNPSLTPDLRRVDAAFGDVAVMKQAAANTNALNGVFTPKQYAAAVRQRDQTRNKSAFAAGTARGQAISDAAVEVLEKDPQSTLAGRLAMQATGTWSLLQNPAVGGAIALAAPVMYSESGLKVMNTLLRSRPEVARKVGDILTQRATREGSITAQQVLEEYNRQTQVSE